MAKISTKTKNQLTDVALAKGWNEDQMYREEASAFTADFLAKFGVFVGLYNKVNETSLSVEDALYQDQMVEQFVALTEAIRSEPAALPTAKKTAKRTGKPKSTKRLSYEAFQTENGSSVAHKIYKHLRTTDKPASRYDISQSLKLRLSTVCGQIAALTDSGLVAVQGFKVDPKSKRTVETLIAR